MLSLEEIQMQRLSSWGLMHLLWLSKKKKGTCYDDIVPILLPCFSGFGGWVVDFGNLKVGLIHVMKEKKRNKRIMRFEPTLFSLYIPSANRFSES